MERMRIHGIDFLLGRRKSLWHLRAWLDGEWVSLSHWKTRKEAVTAAECFVPALRGDI